MGHGRIEESIGELFIFTGNTGMYSPLGGRILHLMNPSYCCISVKPSVTISGCPMGIFPVLLIYGYREVTKLLFTLCRTCSENQQQKPCQHNDEERTLTGTWVTDELKKALEKGYVVQRIYEVWHFV
jgi:hypothetical protein